MGDGVTIWTNPSCSKSRGAEALLAERGVAVERVLYLDVPPTRAELEDLLSKLGTDDPRVLVRRGEPLHAQLRLATAGRDNPARRAVQPSAADRAPGGRGRRSRRGGPAAGAAA